jgi:hypothetical protein
MEVGFDDAESISVPVQKSGSRCNEKRVVVQLSIRSDGPVYEGCVKKVFPPHVRLRYSCMSTEQVTHISLS